MVDTTTLFSRQYSNYISTERLQSGHCTVERRTFTEGKGMEMACARLRCSGLGLWCAGLLKLRAYVAALSLRETQQKSNIM